MFELVDSNEDSFVSLLMMMESYDGSIVLVVEGKDDKPILHHHIFPEKVRILSSNGKHNALAAAKYASNENMLGVFFLIDLDYDDTVALEKNYPLVIFSKSHDLFMDLLIENIEVMCKIIEVPLSSSLSNSEVVKQNLKENAIKILREAVDLSGRLASIRIASEKDGLHLRLEKFPFGKLSSSTPSCKEIAELVKNRSNTNMEVEDIELLIDSSILDQGNISDLSEVKNILNKVSDHDFLSSAHKVMVHHHSTMAKFGINYVRNAFLTSISCEGLKKAAWFYELQRRLSALGVELFSCPHCLNNYFS